MHIADCNRALLKNPPFYDALKLKLPKKKSTFNSQLRALIVNSQPKHSKWRVVTARLAGTLESQAPLDVPDITLLSIIQRQIYGIVAYILPIASYQLPHKKTAT